MNQLNVLARLVLTVMLAVMVIGGSISVHAQDKGSGQPVRGQATETITGRPLSISVLDNLAMDVRFDGRIQFFAGTDAGTFLVVDNRVYGPQPRANQGFQPIAYTPVSNSAPTGSGSVENPFKIVTTVRAGNTGIQLTQTTSYINGDVRYRNDYTITNTSTTAKSVQIFHAADLYLNFPGNRQDLGFGFRDAASGAVGALSQDRRSVQVFIPIASTPPDAYLEANWVASSSTPPFWRFIGGTNGQPGVGFNNTVLNTFHDVAAGFQWNRELAAGGSTTISHLAGFGLVEDVIREEVARPAFITVIQRPNPNTTIRRNGILSYTIIATNRGKGFSKDTTIRVPFDSAALQVVDAQFSRADAWVSSLEDGVVEIRTGPLLADGDVVSGTLRFRVLNVPNGTNLGARLSFRWDDAFEGDEGTSNQTATTVGSSDSNQTYYPLDLNVARAAAGVPRRFSSDIFAPDEPVTLWYNSPSAQGIGINPVRADENGNLNVAFATDDLAPGTYSFVAYGEYTKFTAVQTFEITK